MTIEFTERTLGVWFVTIPNGDYLAHVCRTEDGGAELQYRFRYYHSAEPWDEKDVKNWYRATGIDIAKCLHAASEVSKRLAAISGGERYELLRGEGSLELTDLEAVTLAANLNADTAREQRREIRQLERKLGYARHLIEQLLDPRNLMCRLQAREFLIRLSRFIPATTQESTVPVYIVSDGKKQRIVRAQNQAQARNHVARDVLTVTVAEPEQLVELGAGGVKLEDASNGSDE